MHKLLFQHLPYLGSVSPDTDPTKIYICLSFSLMLPLNIGLPKTPHGLSIDRCHKPCPSVIPNTDQPRLQLRPLSPEPVLPQCWPSQDYCFLVSVMGWSLSSFTRWQTPTNPNFGGCVIQWCCFWVILKITGGFRVIALFTPPLLKYNCRYANWTRGFFWTWNLERSGMTHPQNHL